MPTIGCLPTLHLLLDTHIIVWSVTSDERLSRSARNALLSPGARLLVSAVTAWEYADLHQRRRLPMAADFNTVATMLALETVDLPAEIWRLAVTLPDLHRDPVDRILIAHALRLDATLVTADTTMRRYPVRCLW